MADNPELIYFPPNNSDKEVCPGFLYSNIVSGCPHRCLYCFVQGTAYGKIHGRNTLTLPSEAAARALIDKFLNSSEYAGQMLGLGTETGDLLAVPAMDEIVKYLIGRANQAREGRKVLILSKSFRIEHLLECRPDNVILSFSINPIKVCCDTNTPYVYRATLHRLIDHGYKVRVRIDPIIPVYNWQDEYLSLFYSLPYNVSRITLGSLRFTDTTYQLVPDDLQRFVTRSNPGEHHPWHIPYDTRKDAYDLLVPLMQHQDIRVGLCKEHKDFYGRYGIDPGNCNCLA